MRITNLLHSRSERLNVFSKSFARDSAASNPSRNITAYEECITLPTAVMCACDNIAIGGIEFLLDNYVRVPEQISVAGVDDTVLSSAFRPTLTTLRHATFE